jgi:5-amino-6-(5-phosphoribosylamino)uracil reductase/diaminohydroxyphosphoribosylaminopyrimidine deaminase/5-amino-6-(5-phosphoribosylamino)uracil reductase
MHWRRAGYRGKIQDVASFAALKSSLCMMSLYSGSRQRVMAKPFVTLSYAQTLDGRLATRSGSSQWIGGPESLVFAHRLRASHDAIVVGSGTIRQDDPRLTVRLVEGNNPLRVVVDSKLSIANDAAVLRDGAANGTILATTARAPVARRAALRALGAQVLLLPESSGGVDLGALLTTLAGRGIASLMVEGGARLLTALLREQLVDRLVVCIAPKILGNGIEAIGELDISKLADAISLTDVTWTPCGIDMVLDARVAYVLTPAATGFVR